MAKTKKCAHGRDRRFKRKVVCRKAPAKRAVKRPGAPPAQVVAALLDQRSPAAQQEFREWMRGRK